MLGGCGEKESSCTVDGNVNCYSLYGDLKKKKKLGIKPPTDLGSSSFSVISFIPSWGSQGKNANVTQQSHY